MNLFSRFFVSAAAVTTLLSPALAADYDPPIFVERLPDYVPVEVGSGWYLRGDVTFYVNRPTYSFSLLGRSTDNLRFGGSVGVGYHFNDFLRGDVTAGFVGRDSLHVTDGVDTYSATSSVWSGLVNAYADLGTVVGITPYVGGGVGLLHTRNDFTIPVLNGWVDRQYRFAYALMAGVNYQIADNTSLDLGYQYLSSPGTLYADTDTGAARRGVHYHQLRAGLRYDLW